MFPLGSVLFPTMVLPLHVFEPRYRALARDVVDGDGRFGVVLIERGSEVGGDDVRTSVGTVAEVIDSRELDDGRWVLAAVGRERIRISGWLPDDPYPKAEVAELADEAVGDVVVDLDPLLARLRRTLALQSELGEARAPADVELSPEPAVASLQIGAIGPFGPADQQRVLATTDPSRRLALVDRLLTEATELIEARLGGG
jgi:Lon protease-like protein